jgi:hypothetical protein
MKSAGEIMEILEAYDLVGTYRGAARLAGCDHHTVRHYVERRAAAAYPTVAVSRSLVIDDYRAKIEELVERSEGDIRGDVVFDKLVAMGFDGTDRTTRRAVADAKRHFAAGRRRVYRPWITEPGGWLQFDLGTGPSIAGPRNVAVLCVAGLVTVPGRDPGVGPHVADRAGVPGRDVPPDGGDRDLHLDR